jgi:hypothetical protein
LNNLKTPWHKSIPSAISAQINEAFQVYGKSLPCHVVKVAGAMITVQFDVLAPFNLQQVTIPLFGPEYIRYPIKPNDLGICIAVDTDISYTSGQISTPPNLAPTANLGCNLYFQPVGNKNWVAVDSTAVTIYAPNGVTLRDTNSGDVMVLHPTELTVTIGSTVFHMNGTSVSVTTTNFTVNASGSVSITGASGDVVVNGISLVNHVHTGVQSGSSDTGPAVG